MLEMVFSRRRFLTKALILVPVITTVILVLHWQWFEDVERPDIASFERSIHSLSNKRACVLANVSFNDPAIMKFYAPANKIDCGNSLDDWVTCEMSHCFVKPEVLNTYKDVTCTYNDIVWESDFSVRYGKPVQTKGLYPLQDSDFVKIKCKAKNRATWDGIGAGIRDSVLKRVHTEAIIDDENPVYDIFMLGFDSLSRNAYMRSLPKTYDYLTRKLNAVVLQGYNIVGDGTPQALIPILTGYTELEMPDARKRVKNTVSLDVYPFIWKDMEQHGYVTSYNEDMPNVGTFTHRLNGFAEQPVHHYLRTFQMEIKKLFTWQRSFCIGHQPAHMVMLNYTENFWRSYSRVPRFVFSFHGELSHNSINDIGAIDDDLLQWLQRLFDQQLMTRTIFIMMADHGNRFNAVRNTFQGKVEERLPFFSFVFPQSFQRRYPTLYRNFVDNSKKLTTPFDVHATFKHILQLQALHSKKSFNPPKTLLRHELTPSARERAISLLDVVPMNRSCADAYIEPHWCSCLQWNLVSPNNKAADELKKKLADSILDVINSATSEYRDVCHELRLHRVQWMMKATHHEDMIKFSHSKDRDGLFPAFTKNSNIVESLYQLQITTMPGGAIYEASIHYNEHTLQARTRLSEISRVNKYGSQASCIVNRQPDLRKYCLCRS